jgi:hypothetical protein
VRSYLISLAGGAVISAGCGGLPPVHPLTLLFPTQDCRQLPSPCIGFVSCDGLGITKLHINVSSASTSEDTESLCVVDSSTADTKVYYQPGQDAYFIKASYTSTTSTVMLSSGPFSEDETKTPWTLPVH